MSSISILPICFLFSCWSINHLEYSGLLVLSDQNISRLNFYQDVSLHWLNFIFKVNQVSSAIFCQENEQTHGMLQSLTLDNLTIQAFGFSILVLYFAYRIFSPKRKNCGVEGKPSFKNFDAKPTEAALAFQGELNCCLMRLPQ